PTGTRPGDVCVCIPHSTCSRCDKQTGAQKVEANGGCHKQARRKPLSGNCTKQQLNQRDTERHQIFPPIQNGEARHHPQGSRYLEQKKEAGTKGKCRERLRSKGHLIEGIGRGKSVCNGKHEPARGCVRRACTSGGSRPGPCSAGIVGEASEGGCRRPPRRAGSHGLRLRLRCSFFGACAVENRSRLAIVIHGCLP